MSLLEGIPVSPGYVSGTALIYDEAIERRIGLPHRAISHAEVESECTRVDDALQQSSQDLKRVERTACNTAGALEFAAVASVQATMAGELATLVKRHIGRKFVNVELALETVIHDWVERFQRLDNEFLRQREQDVRDVGRRMTRYLAKSGPWCQDALPSGSVMVAREVLPSEVLELAHSGVVAIVSEYGGKRSHTAILARSLGMVAISGIVNATARIQSGARVLVDGELGTVVVVPSESEEECFAERKRTYEAHTTSLAVDEHLPCVTLDGLEISLLANISRPEEVEYVREHHLAGVGLFRTEFLFLESHERPSCEMQLLLYSSMVRDLGGLPLVIRTFDLGGDKLPPFLVWEELKKHAGRHLRGLRFSLAEHDLLDTQLHAIVKLAQTSDVRILFPMVTGGDDFGRAIANVASVAEQLGLSKRPSIGAMIETPAALYSLDEILDVADFVAIGTNDLTQYMLAADRDLSGETDECTAMHPAVLRAIKQVVGAAAIRQRPVCVCGEEAGDAEFACLLVGLGVRELSLSKGRSAAVRHAIRCLDSRTAREVADLALQCRTPQEVRKLVEQFNPQAVRGPDNYR